MYLYVNVENSSPQSRCSSHSSSDPGHLGSNLHSVSVTHDSEFGATMLIFRQKGLQRSHNEVAEPELTRSVKPTCAL